MIGRLRGTVASCTPSEILLDVAGVGYSLSVSLQTYWAVAASHDRECTLHVHTHVREDAISLYGFHRIEEREAFLDLTAISGVGPKVAMAVLSGVGVEDLGAAVSSGDRARLQRIPGVGKKTAERILLELGDLSSRRRRRAASDAAPSQPLPRPGDPAGPSAVRTDAVSALVHLGYAEEVAVRAVGGAIVEIGEPRAAELESVLRAALKALVR